MLGLRLCARAFSSCGRQGPLFIVVRGPLTMAASLVAEHRLQTRRLSSCGSRAQLFRGMWDLPRPGLEPVSPALAGRFSTTVPPGKPKIGFLIEELLPWCRRCPSDLTTRDWMLTTCRWPSACHLAMVFVAILGGGAGGGRAGSHGSEDHQVLCQQRCRRGPPWLWHSGWILGTGRALQNLLDAVRVLALWFPLLSNERKTKPSFNSLKEEKFVP